MRALLVSLVGEFEARRGASAERLVLPEGARPSQHLVVTTGAANAGRVDDYPDGRVVPSASYGGKLRVDGVTFRAEQ